MSYLWGSVTIKVLIQNARADTKSVAYLLGL
jgi:hypothetical protein